MSSIAGEIKTIKCIEALHLLDDMINAEGLIILENGNEFAVSKATGFKVQIMRSLTSGQREIPIDTHFTGSHNNGSGDTLLHFAARCNDTRFYDKLIGMDANPEALNKYGQKPADLMPDHSLRYTSSSVVTKLDGQEKRNGRQ